MERFIRYFIALVIALTVITMSYYSSNFPVLYAVLGGFWIYRLTRGGRMRRYS